MHIIVFLFPRVQYTLIQSKLTSVIENLAWLCAKNWVILEWYSVVGTVDIL